MSWRIFTDGKNASVLTIHGYWMPTTLNPASHQGKQWFFMQSKPLMEGVKLVIETPESTWLFNTTHYVSVRKPAELKAHNLVIPQTRQAYWKLQVDPLAGHNLLHQAARVVQGMK
ncbi:MAG: hypothetical protein ACRCZF_08315 [Gemmataceae bacterium]